MTRRTTRALTAATFLALALSPGASGDAMAKPTEGERHPALRLPTIDGRTVDLRDFRGKKVLLIEFASW